MSRSRPGRRDWQQRRRGPATQKWAFALNSEGALSALQKRYFWTKNCRLPTINRAEGEEPEMLSNRRPMWRRRAQLAVATVPPMEAVRPPQPAHQGGGLQCADRHADW